MFLPIKKKKKKHSCTIFVVGPGGAMFKCWEGEEAKAQGGRGSIRGKYYFKNNFKNIKSIFIFLKHSNQIQVF